MITATTVLILWGQGKTINLNYSWIELLRIIVLPVTLEFLILRLSITESEMISYEFSINIRLIVLFVYKTLFMCCYTRDPYSVAQTHKLQVMLSATGASRGIQSTTQGTALVRHTGTCSEARRQGGLLVTDHGPQSVVTQYFTPLTLATD